MRRHAVWPVLIGCASLASCDAVFGLADRPLLSDASAPDAADLDADAETDAAAACPPEPSGYQDLATTGCWGTFDTAMVGVTVPGFEGAAFDGRYLYLVPNPGAVVARYDTSLPFSSSASWLTFDVGQALHISPTFAGAVFDGRSVIFAPATGPTYVRYDTQSGFTDATSWSDFDPSATSTVVTMADGFAGGTFDGRYSYFVPNSSHWAFKYDTTAAFTDVPEWYAHNIVGVGDVSPQFFGAAYDGRYVYFAPGSLAAETLGILIRYDTKGDYGLAASFDTFDMTTVSKNAAGFAGAAFDGRYVYFVPSGLAGESAIVTRFDSHGTLGAASSWAAFDVSSLPSGAGHFFGAAFDGRYLYLVPWGTTSSGANGRLARYDTTSAFTAGSSWSTFDTNLVQAASFQGSAFDGQYVYFAPQSGTVVARFRARSTSKMPALPGFHGSFF